MPRWWWSLLSHWSRMSPVVRHRFPPTFSPQSHGLAGPHSQMLSTIGLPVEFEGDVDEALAQHGQRILDQVDLEKGQVRPSASIDASVGFVVLKTRQRTLRFQADVLNLANRLNVINFAGLFSGTALAPPRGFSLRLQADF